MVRIQPLTSSKLAQILKVGSSFEVLFSYGKAVAVLRVDSSTMIEGPIYREDRFRSRTTEGHIEEFAGDRRIEKMDPSNFRLVFLLDLTQHLEEILFKAFDESKQKEETDGE